MASPLKVAGFLFPLLFKITLFVGFAGSLGNYLQSYIY